MISSHALTRLNSAHSGFPHMTRSSMSRATMRAAATTVLLAAACAPSPKTETAAAPDTAAARTAGTVIELRDTTLAATFDAAGIAEPLQQATLSTKLMGTVAAVLVHEGDAVSAGQVLLRIDAREMDAKATQVSASIADAEAMQREATRQANRFRALYADSAATRAQFDAAETGLARADAALRAAKAASSELEAVSSYATVRAPFAGIVTARSVDPGAFAAPGAPLVTVQDVSSIRIRASVAADAARSLARGQHLAATVDGDSATATVEAVVPTASGNLFTLNALLPNSIRAKLPRFRAGSAVTLAIPTGTTQAIVVPRSAIVHEGDLTGLIVRGAQRDERRWIRLGAMTATSAIVSSGVRVGESIVVPTSTTATTGR